MEDHAHNLRNLYTTNDQFVVASAAADYIEQLEAIVRRLPTTMDGAPVVPGVDVWLHPDVAGEVTQGYVDSVSAYAVWIQWDGETESLRNVKHSCYATREAAEAANGGE